MLNTKYSNNNIACRFSEYENLNNFLDNKNMYKYLWIDCFTKFPLCEADAVRLKNSGFKLCLVSPELQGRNAEIEIPTLVSLLKAQNIKFDAVCTKRPDLWEK
jgi:hypothetical protein